MIKPGDLIFDNNKVMQGIVVEVICPGSDYFVDYIILYNNGVVEGAHSHDIDYLKNCFPFCMENK
jgi:hypothetical protein